MMKYSLIVALLVLGACFKPAEPAALFAAGDYAAAYRLWLPLAEAGDAAAQNYIGIHHYLGLGVKRNLRQAMQWFEQSARAGEINAQYNLGLMYENGHHVQQDYVKAYTWYYIAAERGSGNAARRIRALNNEYLLPPFQIWRAIDVARTYLEAEPQMAE